MYNTESTALSIYNNQTRINVFRRLLNKINTFAKIVYLSGYECLLLYVLLG